MSLREMAANWCQAACHITEIQAEFMHRLDGALQLGVGCSFALGRALTRTGKPYLAHCFWGEFFAFELTPAQAASLGVREDQLVCYHSRQEQDHAAKAAPVVGLDEVIVDGAAMIDRSAPITGAIRFRANELIFQPLALHASCEPPGRGALTLFHHFHELVPSSGAIHFSLAPLGAMPDRDSAPYAGPLAIFFQVWTLNGPVRPLTTIVHPSAGKPPQPPGFESWKPPLMTPWASAPTANPPAWGAASSSAPAVPISDIRAVLLEVA